MSFGFECRQCGKQGEVPDDQVTPHEHDQDGVRVMLPPGWFADPRGVVCLDCTEPDWLRAYVREQIELQQLQQLWEAE